MNNRPTPETDAIVRNAATADHPPTRLAATLTVKCEKLERERDEARAEMIRWMSIAEGRGRTDDEEENDTQSELAAWEMLTEATRERDEANKELHKQIVLFDELFAEAEKIRIERDEAREAWKCIDEAIFTMKPRHIGHPTMDGRYPCWEVWLPQWGRVERKSLQDALLEFVAQIKEKTK